MKKICLVLVLFLTVNLSFGQIVRELDAFTQLDVTDKINVKLIPSSVDKIIIEGDLASQLEVIMVNDILRLKMSGTNVLQGGKVSVELHSSKVMSIIARKGALVDAENRLLSVDSIYLSANEGANIDLALNARSVKALATTGGSIFLSGKTFFQDIDIAAGGSYLTRDMKSNDAYVRVNAGGKVVVTVSDFIDAQTRAGGIIDVYGAPKDRKHKKFAGGKINFY